MSRVKYLSTVNQTEQKVVELLYGAMEREGLQKRDVAAGRPSRYELAVQDMRREVRRTGGACIPREP